MRNLQYIASILKKLRALTDNNCATATGEIPHVQIVLFADFLSSIYNKTYTAGWRFKQNHNFLVVVVLV